MAVSENLNSNLTYISGAALTQYTFVVGPAADGQIDPAGAGAAAIGVVLDDAAGAGKAVAVARDGRVKVLAAGTIARGANVASNATGRAVAASTGNIILGIAEDAAVTGQYVTVTLDRRGTAA